VLAAVALPAAAAVTATVSGAAALVLLAVGLVTLATTVLVGRRASTVPVGAARGRAQGRVVEAVDAWEELAGLGAVGVVRAAATRSLAAVTHAEDRAARATGRAATVADLGSGLAALGVLAACVAGGAPVAPSVLVVLLAAGTVELLGTLPDAGVAWRTAAEAAARLDDLVGDTTSRPTGTLPLPAGPAVRIDAVPLAPGGAPVAVELDLPAGSLTVVRGASGSGKTTLLRVLAGELGEGTVALGGESPAAYAPGRVVLVTHDDRVFAGTVLDNLRLADPALDAERADDLLDAFGLAARGITPQTLVGVGGRELSGGEARRLTLARAVAVDPAVLLLDEPTEGLDPATAEAALGACRRLLPQTTIVAAVHDRAVLDGGDVRLDWPSGAGQA